MQRADTIAVGEPEGHYDAVVMGGGLSGLTAAYRLRNRSVLVLEHATHPGGSLWSERWQGHWHPVAGASFGEPTGEFALLLEDLKLRPEPIPEPKSCFLNQGTVMRDWLGTFASLRRDLQAIPPEAFTLSNAGLTPDQRRLDSQSLHSYVRGRYGDRVAHAIDLYCRGVFGVNARLVSAWAGLRALSEELGTLYTFEGGFGRISRALTKALGKKLRTQATVVKVTVHRDDIRIVYLDEKNLPHTVQARAAVFAVPASVTLRLLPQLPAYKRRALQRVQPILFAVAVFLMPRPLWSGGYSLWTENRVFTHLFFPEWVRPRSMGWRSQRQLALAVLPMRSLVGRAGGQPIQASELLEQAKSDLAELFPDTAATLSEGRLYRWAHTMPIPFPGFLTHMRPDLRHPVGRLFFAGSETEGFGVEAAVASGARAAREVQEVLP